MKLKLKEMLSFLVRARVGLSRVAAAVMVMTMLLVAVAAVRAASAGDTRAGSTSASRNAETATASRGADTRSTDSSAAGHRAAEQAILPPLAPWSGKSLALIAAADDPWITPGERSGLTRTPSYAETVAWLQRLTAAAPELHLTSLGKSDEGRDIWMVVASRERAFTPRGLKAAGKPTLLVQAGIHSGEIDGKDAGLMLLRDMTVKGTRAVLLEGANLLFIPILNVDGHERSSRHGRINQRGPVEMGWRTNARNLNLNRDYSKLDTPGVRAAVRVLNEWQPELYFDVHVTDGMDYEYDITYGYAGPRGYSPSVAGWLDGVLKPVLDRELEAQGHTPGPLIFRVDGKDISKGLEDWTGSPRYSNGYGEARHVATVLFENHSLKPYRRRVLGTYVALEASLRVLAAQGEGLRQATVRDGKRRPETVTLSWKADDPPSKTITFKGIEWCEMTSNITGSTYPRWTGRPAIITLPHRGHTTPDATARRARAYWVPATWRDVIEILSAHGIRMERTAEPREVPVEMYRVKEYTLGEPFEGRVPVTATFTTEKHVETFPAGSVRVPTDQPLGDLAALLLEPAATDSLFAWGFFHSILQQTEYVEDYVMVPMAQAMFAEDPAFEVAFRKRVAEDPAFAADPQARLQWLYARTPFFDARYRLYPVARE